MSIKNCLTLWALASVFVCCASGSVNPGLSLFEPLIADTVDSHHPFPLAASGNAAPLVFDEGDYPGVVRAIRDLQGDIHKVTGITPVVTSKAPQEGFRVIIGTVGKSREIDALVGAKKLDVKSLMGKWESFVIATVEDPCPGVPLALVIAGSDKRGTIFGVYEISRQIGVSPWYWWADVPVASREALFVKGGSFASGEPSVKYRGIFINDEAPALRNWAQEKFGGLTPEFYRHVFELLLRSRANYLWPAMWLPTSFYDDYPANAALADEYGIVMSTSHHEPMMRAHHEWTRYGKGHWNYTTNGEQLRAFWREGLKRVRPFEKVITVGMRGDGDEAMAETTAVPLLRAIIADQRKIIEDVMGQPASAVPQVWALYKEVQDYYDNGLVIDDDVLVLFSDDNWGNVRYLPKPNGPMRKGGFGMYYHVDYVGAPVSYRWLNVSQIERIWDQMELTYSAGVKDLWIVNVGDIKPMELPMSFFLDLAWNPKAIGADDLKSYYVHWSAQQFGESNAADVAGLLERYTKYSARRTPEMLSAGTFSVENYREADRILAEFRALLSKADAVENNLPAAYHDAYFQLLRFPIEALATTTELYIAAGKNRHYAERGAASANFYADRVKLLFDSDARLTRRFHTELSGGKWNHMMSQTHLGYTSWNHPPLNRTPPVTYVQLRPKAELGFFLENSQKPRWGWLDVEADWDFAQRFERFERMSSGDRYIDIVNRGEGVLQYSIVAGQPWIKLSKSEGAIQYDEKVYVSIDWENAPSGLSEGQIFLRGAGVEYTLTVPIRNEVTDAVGFLEQDRVVSIEPSLFDRHLPAGGREWKLIPNLGRTGTAVTPRPRTHQTDTDSSSGPVLEYDFTLVDPGEAELLLYLSPTLDFKREGGLKISVALDGIAPVVVNINQGEEAPDWKFPEWWMKSVGDHIKVRSAGRFHLPAGKHTLKLIAADEGVVVQKIVIDAGGLKPSYLGPPISPRVKR